MAVLRFNYWPTRADLRGLLRLAGPIVLIQVGLMSMGVVDTIMVGQVSATALAAVALGHLYTFGVSVFGLGTLLALDAILSQSLGANDRLAVTRGLQRGLLLSLLLAVPTSALLLTVGPVLTWLDQPPEVIPIAAGYVYRTLPAVWPLYAFVVLRQTLQAHRCTRPVVFTIVLGNLINAGLNYALIFGKLGFPPLGALGAAWSTLACRWLMAAMLFAFGWLYLGPYLRGLAPRVFDLKPIGRMLRVGAPIGAQVVLEWGAFGAIGLLMGSLGTVQVAAHQVAMSLASLAFMVPVGVSSAAAVIVGHAVGRQDAGGVRRAAVAALLIGAGFMACTAAAFLGFPEFLAGIYTEHAAVLGLAALLLPIAGLFQVFDGIQAVSIGVLRGLGDTRVPMMVSIVGFWCLGIPVSLWLAYARDLGALGLWWGLVVGLTAVAAFLLLRIKHRVERDLVRIMLDEHIEPQPGPNPLEELIK